MLDLVEGVLTEFTERSATPDLSQFVEAGLGIWQKDNPVSKALYRLKNRDKIRARNRAWRAKNKKHVSEYNRRYREAHK